MRTILLSVAIFLALVSAVAAQTEPKKNEPKDAQPTATGDSKTQPSATPDKASDNRTTAADPAAAAPAAYVRPTADKRFKKYIGSMFGPWSLGRAVASAG